ncbi:MAG: hypothetical protein WC875_01460 [Candidatus Absconditabacterales bacterium]
MVTLLMIGFCEFDVNPFGPVHETVPELTIANNISEFPEHIVVALLFTAIVGGLFTITVVALICEQPAEVVAVTRYVPVIATVAFPIIGLDEVNPFGPVHENVDIGLAVAFNKIEFPAQTGELLPAVTVGKGFTVTVVGAVLLHPKLLVTVTKYGVVAIGAIGKEDNAIPVFQ